MVRQLQTLPMEGRFVIVTGGSRGIGKAIALDLASKGAQGIAITYAGNETAANEVVSEIQKFGTAACAIKADLFSPQYGETVVQGARKGLNTDTFHILVNNAAVVEFDFSLSFETETKANFDKSMHGNVWAPLLAIQAFLPYVAPTGRIINISTLASSIANADPLMTYGASKAALDNYTRSLAKKYAPLKKITINSVQSGAVRTESAEELFRQMPALEDMMASQASAEHRIADTRDVANVVSFLAGEEGRWINGHMMPAHGGACL